MVLLNLLAGLALLIWGSHQMQRALRDVPASWVSELGRLAARGRYAAWAAGLLAGLLQAQEDPVRRGVQLARLAQSSAAGAQAAILGGLVGCAFMVVAFTIAPAWTFHVLLIAGAAAWNARQPMRAAGRAVFGAGVVLLGLQILTIAGAQAADPDLLAAMARGLEQEALLASLLGALAAYLLRSGFVAVLLVAAVGTFWMPAEAALALLPGIHVGGALAGHSLHRGAGMQTRLVLGHFLAMLLAAVAMLLLLPDLSRLTGAFGNVDFALANAAFCGLGTAVLLNLTGPLTRTVERLLPNPRSAAGGGVLPHLDTLHPDEPSLGLSEAVRQVMRLADLVGQMLHRVAVAILENDRVAIEAVGKGEQEVDKLYRATKHRLAKIPPQRLAAHEQQRWEELMMFLIALEQIADRLNSMMRPSQAWNAQRQFAYPPSARAEFRELHGQLSRNLTVAAGLCLERWPAAAVTLLAAEEAFRKLERSACAAHIARVVAADPASIAVSALHLDLLADLAEMNARLCGFARFFLELHEAGPMDCGVPAKPVTPAMHALEESSD